MVEHRTCLNGVPVGSGGFLTIVKCPDKRTADEVYLDFCEIASKLNARQQSVG